MNYIEKIYSKSPIALQLAFLNAKALELYLERYGSKFWRLFHTFEQNQWLSKTELEAYQNEKIRILIRHAYKTVPYYNTLMKRLNLRPEDFKSIDDLHKLPVLTKEEVKKNFRQLISGDFRKISLRHGHTSGTTGSPLHICYNIETCVVHHAADWRQKNWAGMEYGEAYTSVQGKVIVPLQQDKPPFWRKNYINNQLFLSSFHLKEKNLPYYFEKLEKDNIKFIEGYPSTLYILAIYLNKHRKTFPMKAVLTSSETLFDYQREAIEKAFCCNIFDFFGMAERVVFASECDRHRGHHLNSDYGVTEFLDSSNEPVKRGQKGMIVATGLYNLAMPLIRYQTGDTCALKAETCTCGRGFPLIEDIVTKDESIVTLPDGRLISPSVLTHPFKPMDNISASQIIQEELNQLVIKIVRKEGYNRKDEAKLISAFNDRLGDQMKIRVEYVDSIEKEKSGKYKWVISKIPAKF